MMFSISLLYFVVGSLAADTLVINGASGTGGDSSNASSTTTSSTAVATAGTSGAAASSSALTSTDSTTNGTLQGRFVPPISRFNVSKH